MNFKLKLKAGSWQLKAKQGFTLVEILMVLVVISILGAIIIVSVQSAIEKGQDVAIKAELVKIQSLAKMYFAQNGQTYGEEWLYNSGSAPIISNTLGPCPGPNDTGNTMFHANMGPIAKQINNAIQAVIRKSSADIAGCAVTKDPIGPVSYAVAVRDYKQLPSFGSNRHWTCLDSVENNFFKILERPPRFGHSGAPVDFYDFSDLVYKHKDDTVRCAVGNIVKDDGDGGGDDGDGGGDDGDGGGDDDPNEVPSITINTPDALAIVSGTIPFSATATDIDGQVNNVEFFYREGTADFFIGTDFDGSPDVYSVDWGTTSALDGNHSIKATAYDEDGGSKSASRTVIVDNGNPTVAVTAPTANPVFRSNPLTITAEANDSVSGIDYVEFFYETYGSGGWLPVIHPGNPDFTAPYSIDTPNALFLSSGGSSQIQAVATDKAGNTASASISFGVN